MFGSGVGIIPGVAANAAITVVAAITSTTSTARWAAGTATTLAPRTTTLVSALFVTPNKVG